MQETRGTCFFQSEYIKTQINMTHTSYLLYELEVIIWVASFQVQVYNCKNTHCSWKIILGHDDTKKYKNGWQWTYVKIT